MAAVCVTSGPGSTNTLTGVMGAWVDSVPMIVISGNVRYATSVENSGLPLRYRGLQEFDIIHSIQNMTKYAKVLTRPEDTKYEVEKAVDLAMNGRRGPVWIDVPQDIQNSTVDTECLRKYTNTNRAIEDVYEDIQKYTFAAQDTALYLDTHPNDLRVLERHNYYADKLKDANEEYEQFNNPIDNTGVAEGFWNYIYGPWVNQD